MDLEEVVMDLEEVTKGLVEEKVTEEEEKVTEEEKVNMDLQEEMVTKVVGTGLTMAGMDLSVEEKTDLEETVKAPVKVQMAKLDQEEVNHSTEH